MGRVVLPRHYLCLICSCWTPATSQYSCFCQYNESSADEPLWFCGNGVRVYSCAWKLHYGRNHVLRLLTGDVQAEDDYCTGARAYDPCEAEVPGGLPFTLLYDPDRIVQESLAIKVLCAPTANCSFYEAFLGLVCEDGPWANETPTATQWVVEQAWGEVRSPSHASFAHAEPFGTLVAVFGDTLIALNPVHMSLSVYERGAAGIWSTAPVAEIQEPAGPTDTWGDILAFSDTAVLAGFYQGPLDADCCNAPQAQRDPWTSQGQTAYLFPRGADGVWDTVPIALEGEHGTGASNIDLGSTSLTAGFGVAVAVSHDYAIIGSKYSGMYCNSNGGAFIYERVAGVWNPTPVEVAASVAAGGSAGVKQLGTGASFYLPRPTTCPTPTPTPSFGQLVAISDDGIAFVSSPGAQAVYVFEYTSGAWSSRAQLDDPPGTVPSDYPASMVASGGYIILSAPSAATAYVFERQSLGSWSAAIPLTSSAGTDAGFGSIVAIDDRGSGLATAVVNAPLTRQVFLYQRDDTSALWSSALELRVSGAGADNPQGFGRSVDVAGDVVAVGSEVKKVFLFTLQVIGYRDATSAVPLTSDGSSEHTISLDARHLRVGVPYRVCFDYPDDERDFVDAGLGNILLKQGARLPLAEEL